MEYLLLFLFFSGGLLKRNSKAVTEREGWWWWLLDFLRPVNQYGYIRVKWGKGGGERERNRDKRKYYSLFTRVIDKHVCFLTSSPRPNKGLF